MVKILIFKGAECKSADDIQKILRAGLCGEAEYREALRQFDEMGRKSFFEQNSERVYKVFSAYEFTNRNVSKNR